MGFDALLEKIEITSNSVSDTTETATTGYSDNTSTTDNTGNTGNTGNTEGNTAGSTLLETTKPSAFTSPEFTDCGGTINDESEILSPNYPNNYTDHSRCTWDINVGGDVAGIFIIPEEFSLEEHWGQEGKCGFDHLKVVANGVESNFCGSNEPYFGKDMRQKDGKWTPDLPNASNAGFTEMFIRGHKATVSFHSDYSISQAGFKLKIVKADRLDLITHFAQQVIDSVSDKDFGGRYSSRMNKVLRKARASYTGESCKEESQGSSDEAADVTVFNKDDLCKLNGQVNAALNSWARNYACRRKGNKDISRQIIRQAKKTKAFFSERAGCDDN